MVTTDQCTELANQARGKSSALVAVVPELIMEYTEMTFKDEVRRKIVAALALNLYSLFCLCFLEHFFYSVFAAFRGVEQAALRNVVINGDADLARRRLLSSNIEVTYELVVKSTQERDAAAAAVGVKGEEMFCYELCEVTFLLVMLSMRKPFEFYYCVP